ncbi:hypothetical protein WJX72_007217 [[Myrmecia] bisecta]|uniref:Protein DETOXIFICATION n=1 Tax=[Myrmecia] bisecta TaxID=41462 RepID=A0AAW1R6Q4_9CHLO
MSLVDTALVGRLGAPQLASMGLSSVIFAFSNVLFSFLMVLTTPKIARAVAQNKLSQASKITAESLWVAACAGVVMTTILWFGCPYAVAALKTPPEVAKYAISYLRCRALASPAVLMLFVSVGTFRGFADTKTPLYAAVLSNLTNFGMDIFLMFGLGMGVAGAALATSISQYVSVGVLLYMLTRKGMLDLADLRRVPVFKDILPLLKTGFSLSVRSFSSIIVITMCSTMLAEMGAVTMAAHEILRQVWIFSIQAYGAFDIATQTLVATYIGKNKRPLAREVLMRILQIGTLTGCMMAVFLFATRSVLPVAFTKDSAVASLARYVMPVVALYMPMDAIASIMDGGLLGASDTNYVAVASLGTGVVAFAALLVARRMGTDLLGIWMALKLLTLGRVVTGSLRYASASSPFAPSRDHQDQDAMAQPQSQASSSNGRESENGSGKQASALQQHQTGQHEQHSSAANGHDHGNGNGNGKSKGQRRSSDVSRRVNEVSAGLASQMQDTTIPGDASGSAMGSAL